MMICTGGFIVIKCAGFAAFYTSRNNYRSVDKLDNLLQGDLDFAAFMKELRATGYDGWITPEVSSINTPAEISAQLDTIFAM